MSELGLLVENAHLLRGGQTILDGVGFALEPGRLNGLIGPNGAGKSSLLRVLLGLERGATGAVRFGGEDLRTMPGARRATIAALVEQSATAETTLDALGVVLLGRIPHQGFWATGPDAADHRVAAEALRRVGMERFGGRLYTTLSGGEQQHVQIARALAQEPRLLLLDEPTSHLDVAAQLAVLGLLRDMTQGGLTVLAAIHDLNLAASFFDHLVVLDRGRVVVTGTPDEVLTLPLLRDVYGVEAEVFRHPRTGRPMIAYREATADSFTGVEAD